MNHTEITCLNLKLADSRIHKFLTIWHNQRVIWGHFLSFSCFWNPTCFITKIFDLPVLEGMQIPTTTSSDCKFNSAHLQVTKNPWKYYLSSWHIPLFVSGQYWNNVTGLIRSYTKNYSKTKYKEERSSSQAAVKPGLHCTIYFTFNSTFYVLETLLWMSHG